MKPIVFFTLLVTTIVAVLGMFQVQLVQDVVTTTGYPSTEIESGMVAIVFIFYTMIGIFTVR